MASTKKASGVSPKAAKTAYNGVKADLANLQAHIRKLQQDVELMNKTSWYGNKAANKWYTDMNKHYEKLVVFEKGVENFQASLQRVFSKAVSSDIQF